jgi:hypothetical protein
VGRLAARLKACLQELLDLPGKAPPPPNANMSAPQKRAWSAYVAAVKALLYAHLSGAGDSPGTVRCDLLAQLCQVAVPDPGLDGQAFTTATQAAQALLTPIWMAAIQDCICLLLLPPCPDPVQDPRLPLAVVTVSGGAECSVQRICNWTPLRRLVGTTPNLGYWLSAFSVVDVLRRQVFCACCQDLPVPLRQFAAREAGGAAFAGTPLGPLGALLQGHAPAPADLLGALQLAPDATALHQRLAALEAEVRRLGGNI